MTPEPTTNIWLFLEVLTLRRGLIFSLVFLAAIVSIVVALLLPSWYEAGALLLPPKNMSASLSATSNLAEITSITGGIELPIRVTPSDVYARMLRSRAVLDRIIEIFDLKARYGLSGMHAARTELLSHTRFRVTEEGLLSVRVEDRDPKSAADMANAFVDQLNMLNQDIVSGRARQSREFIGLRLETVREELQSARSAMEQFQTKHRALDFDQQTRLAIDQATQLKIELAKMDIEIGLNKKVLGAHNPDLVEMNDERKAILSQLEKIEHGGSDTSYFSLPLDAIPRLRGEYEALNSRVTVSESVYLTLLELHEQARIQEETESTSLSILDRAAVPEIRSRPQRTLIVVGSTGAALIFSLLLATFLEYFRRLSGTRPDDYRRMLVFVDAYFGWLPGVRRNR